MPINDVEPSALGLTINNLADAARCPTTIGVVIASTARLIIWLKTTDPVPFSNDSKDNKNQDLQRYERMCRLYLSQLEKVEIPCNWVLVNDCPTLYRELTGNTEQIKQICSALQGSEAAMKHIIISIISSIEELFESISKRTYSFRDYKKFRQDGFEKMFFCELVRWLSTELIGAPIKSPKTALMIQQQIDYCKEVKSTVFFYRDDNKKHNPINTLDRIIDRLTLLHKDVCKSIEAASFNDYIERMGANLVDMSANALGACYLMLDEVHRGSLQVDEILEPDAQVDHKIIALLQSTMGQWLKTTLDVAGITGNNFQSTKQLDVEVINNHLKLDLNQLDLKKTGLHDFILNNRNKKTKEEKKRFIHDILSKVATVYREILNVYNVKASMVNSARVSVEFGQNRLYGHESGKTLMRGLFCVIRDTGTQFKKATHELWSLYYKDTYLSYAKENGISNTDATYRFLNEANNCFKRIEGCDNELAATLLTIAHKVDRFENDAESTLQREYKLICDIYSHMCRRNCSDKDLLGSVKKLTQDHVSVPPAVLKAIQPKIEPYIVRFPIANMPLYTQAKKLFSTANDGLINFSLMQRPTKPYSDFHASLYDKFLKPYHSTVTAGRLYSYYREMTGYKMQVLRNFYSKLNTLMTSMYRSETLIRIETQESIRPNVGAPLYQLGKGVVTCWETELLLINQCIRQGWYHFENEMNPNAINMMDEIQLLHAKLIDDKNIEVSIDHCLLNYAGAGFAKEVADTREEVAHEKAAHALTREEVAHEKAAHALTREEVAIEKAAHDLTREEVANEKAAHALTREEVANEKMGHDLTREEVANETAAHALTREEVANEKMGHAFFRNEYEQEKAAHAATSQANEKYCVSIENMGVKLGKQNTILTMVDEVELIQKTNELGEKKSEVIDQKNAFINKDSALAHQTEGVKVALPERANVKRSPITSEKPTAPVVFFCSPVKQPPPPNGKVKVSCAFCK